MGIQKKEKEEEGEVMEAIDVAIIALAVIISVYASYKISTDMWMPMMNFWNILQSNISPMPNIPIYLWEAIVIFIVIVILVEWKRR